MKQLDRGKQLQCESYVRSMGPDRFPTVVLSGNVIGADGRLVAQAGGRGWLVSQESDRAMVLLTCMHHTYVELDGSGLRQRSVPYSAVQRCDWSVWAPRDAGIEYRL